MDRLGVVMKSLMKSDWALPIDLTDEYLHVPIRPNHRKFLRVSLGQIVKDDFLILFQIHPDYLCSSSDTARQVLNTMGFLVNLLKSELVLLKAVKFIGLQFRMSGKIVRQFHMDLKVVQQGPPLLTLKAF